MNITDRESEVLLSLLRRIRAKANNPNRKRNEVENMCDRATLIINKAKRRNKN